MFVRATIVLFALTALTATATASEKGGTIALGDEVLFALIDAGGDVDVAAGKLVMEATLTYQPLGRSPGRVRH